MGNYSKDWILSKVLISPSMPSAYRELGGNKARRTYCRTAKENRILLNLATANPPIREEFSRDLNILPNLPRNAMRLCEALQIPLILKRGALYLSLPISL